MLLIFNGFLRFMCKGWVGRYFNVSDSTVSFGCFPLLECHLIFYIYLIIQTLSLSPKSIFLSSLSSQLGQIYDSKSSIWGANKSYHLLERVLLWKALFRPTAYQVSRVIIIYKIDRACVPITSICAEIHTFSVATTLDFPPPGTA